MASRKRRLLSEIDATYRAAMNAEVEYQNKRGAKVTQKKPDFRAAAECLRLRAQVEGLIVNKRKEIGKEMSLDELKERMRKSLARIEQTQEPPQDEEQPN